MKSDMLTKGENKYNDSIYFVRQNKKLKGVLFASIDPDDGENILIGFSMANQKDILPIENIEGLRLGGFNKDFGLRLAKKRSSDYRSYKNVKFFLGKDNHGKRFYTIIHEKDLGGRVVLPIFCPDLSNSKLNGDAPVSVPTTLIKPLFNFVKNCERYYKNKLFPAWVGIFINYNEPIMGKVQ